MQVEKIAQVAHEMNKAYCESIGDNSQPSWEDAPEWQKDSAMVGVQFHLDNPDAGPSASHESWLKQKEADGWKYGPEKNPEKKEHPCYVPYDELPVEQRAKDYIFRQVIHSLKDVNEIPTIKEIAKFAYDMTIAYDAAYGYDVSAKKDWNALSFDDKQTFIDAALVFLGNPEAASSEPYTIWLNENIAAGWQYGPAQVNSQKISPAIIPYEDLSVDRKIKDALIKQATLCLVIHGQDNNPGNAEQIQIAAEPPAELEKESGELTFGQKAVGLNFNPSKDDEVARCKQIFADAIDQMHDFRKTSTSEGAKRHASTAITMIEDAQMRAVKALTWKD